MDGQLHRLEFVRVEGGCYDMGCTSGSNECESDEYPVHEVCVDGFWMGKYEVTNAQYRQYESSHDSQDFNGHSLNGNNQPAVYVTWNDAKVYADWLSSQTGYTFRLPTEAEWEYAARAGTTTARYWGDDPDGACQYESVGDQQAANAFGWLKMHNCDDGYAVSAPVGSFEPNDLGLYDMLSNTREWCSDRYASDAYSYHERNNPKGPSSGTWRVFRDGCCNSGQWACVRRIAAGALLMQLTTSLASA